MLRVGRAAGEVFTNGERTMSNQKMLDIASRIAEIERKAQEAEARAAAAEARAVEAERRAAEAEAGKPKPKAGFVELKPNPRYEYAKGVEMLPNGKTVEIVVNREGYAELTYNKRFWKDAQGRHHPTRGISGDPAECAYLLAWMLENPEAVTRWAEFATAKGAEARAAKGSA